MKVILLTRKNLTLSRRLNTISWKQSLPIVDQNLFKDLCRKTATWVLIIRPKRMLCIQGQLRPHSRQFLSQCKQKTLKTWVYHTTSQDTWINDHLSMISNSYKKRVRLTTTRQGKAETRALHLKICYSSEMATNFIARLSSFRITEVLVNSYMKAQVKSDILRLDYNWCHLIAAKKTIKSRKILRWRTNNNKKMKKQATSVWKRGPTSQFLTRQ